MLLKSKLCDDCFRVPILPTQTCPAQNTKTGEHHFLLLLTAIDGRCNLIHTFIMLLLSSFHHTGKFSFCPLVMMFFSSYFSKKYVKQRIVPNSVLRCDDSFLFNLLFLLYPCAVLVHSATERRSRLLFMRQWSQVGPSKKGKISREELEKWAESLNSLLASQSEFYLMKHLFKEENPIK